MKKIILIPVFTFTFSLFTSFCGAQSFAGVTYDSLSSGMTGPGAYVLALAMKDSISQSNLYAGGRFTVSGRNNARNIAEWNVTSFPNGGTWAALGKGVDSDVCALQMYGKYLYAGGKFDSAGGIASSHIACWDTAALKWDSLVGKLNGNVYALCLYNNELYVGGDFTVADGDTVNRIAMWNGTAWAAVGKGFDTGAVYALTVFNDTLYAGGSFRKSNGLVLNHVAEWKGAMWDSLSTGTNNTVYALASQYSGLYAGGAFTQSGGVSTNYISYFDGARWGQLGSGVNDTVRVLDVGFGAFALLKAKEAGQGLGNGNILLVGGNFTKADGYSCHYLAGWFEGWDTIGNINGPVYALANPFDDFAGANYIGGKFDFAKNVHASSNTVNNVAYIGIFLGGGIQSLSDNSNVNVYPNPSNGEFTVSIRNGDVGIKNVEVYNILGEQVYSASLTIDNSQFTIDLSSRPNGIYLYRITAADGNPVGEGKLAIQK